jgi:hypothetical protein
MLPASALAQDVGLAALLSVVAALGLCLTTGLRAYLPLLVVGITSSMPGPYGYPLLPLRPEFAALGSPLALVLLGVLALAEFGVDKVPTLDHISDVFHTLVRPLAGAAILAGTVNGLSDMNMGVAALIGGLLALGVHGLKSMARHAVSTTTVGMGSAIASTLEDALVVATLLAFVAAPLLGVVLVVVIGLVLWRVLGRLYSRFRDEVVTRSQVIGMPAGGAATPVITRDPYLSQAGYPSQVAYPAPSTPAIAYPPMQRPAPLPQQPGVGMPVYDPRQQLHALPPLPRASREPALSGSAARRAATPAQQPWPQPVAPVTPAGPVAPRARQPMSSPYAQGWYDPGQAQAAGVYPNDAPTIPTMRSLRVAPVAPRQPRGWSRRRSA